MAERVDQAALSFPVLHIVPGAISVGTCRSGSLEHPVDVVDPKHDLICHPGHALIVSEFAHDHFGALGVDTELHAMALADTDVLNQPEHLDIPGGCVAHVGHGEHWDHPRPWR